MFDPKKHRKTQEKLATLKTISSLIWPVAKPKKRDFVRAYGNSLEDLAVINIFEQRDGGGQPISWLIQGKDDKEDDAIVDAIGAGDIVRALVVPTYIKANNSNYIWLGKQGKVTADKTHSIHSQIRECVETAQKKWCKIWFDTDTKQYLCEPPENAPIFGEPKWPSEEEMLKHLQQSFKDRIIETADHEIVKRTRGIIV